MICVEGDLLFEGCDEEIKLILKNLRYKAERIKSNWYELYPVLFMISA
jgi:hypothetical protein